jgi:hypothetical protein
LLLQYVLFRAKNFHCAVTSEIEKDLRTANGPFRDIQQKFPDFQGTYQQLAQKVYKCVNMFLETGSFLRKKGSGRPTKRTAEQRIAETPNTSKSIRRLTQETNLSFGTVQLTL